MKYKIVVPIMILFISAVLVGCIFKPEEKLLPEGYDKENVTIKYIDSSGPIISIQDFPDFRLLDHMYLAAADNLSLTLESESAHGTFAVNTSDNVPEGYRLYGSSETHNSSQRYLLVQYKVFDKDEKLNDAVNTTVYDYINNGFRSRPLNGTSLNGADYKGRIFILESNITNRTDKSMKRTNMVDMNVIVILFEYDTVIGKIGVQDYKNKSLNESLKILEFVSDRLKVNEKQVKVAKNIFGNHVVDSENIKTRE